MSDDARGSACRMPALWRPESATCPPLLSLHQRAMRDSWHQALQHRGTWGGWRPCVGGRGLDSNRGLSHSHAHGLYNGTAPHLPVLDAPYHPTPPRVAPLSPCCIHAQHTAIRGGATCHREPERRVSHHAAQSACCAGHLPGGHSCGLTDHCVVIIIVIIRFCARVRGQCSDIEWGATDSGCGAWLGEYPRGSVGGGSRFLGLRAPPCDTF